MTEEFDGPLRAAAAMSATRCVSRFARVFAMAVLLVSLWAGPSAAQRPRDDAKSRATFTEAMATRFRQAQPTWSITIKESLTLLLTTGSGANPLTANLDRIYAVCLNDPPNCEAVSAGFVARASSLGTPPAAVEAARLRATIRPTAYIESLRRTFPEADRAPIAVPFVAGLWIVCVFDEPTTMRVANADNLRTLGLGVEDAVVMARRNTMAALVPLSTRTKPLQPGQYGVLAGDAYESSRLLAPEAWAELAAGLSGNLLVAVPSAEKLLYGSGATNAEIDALAALAQDAYRKAERPISPSILKWTATGWVPTAP
jgi:hypothetical protein